ncbi:putative adenylyltransferase/sulfurtransferase MoeZ [wastewater metagenome]|uniref:Putative adenylyltransferase/sulfurtransferase MoeZ n=2 Tax=unclassified sequences TaxID=12908 RepID=A0A5B8REU6_9ZZZZ|nr:MULTISPECIES: rhodanese-like domain-containing protein [Arhodomonas]MCS4503045.1 rhodanese-like domain-containing protein [Arhodomonas aquaeolei]QEA06034.1 putative adenylyltransferase/sulfurtransferase MoeZ [uncultured organism]
MRSVNASELADWLAGEAPPQLIDVREPWEHGTASLAQASLVPLALLPQRLDELSRERPTVVMCHHGVRSAMAAGLLERAGFTDVINLDGGIDAWSVEVDPAVPRY